MACDVSPVAMFVSSIVLLGSEDDGNDDDDDECDKLEVVQLQFVKLSGLVRPSLKMEFW